MKNVTKENKNTFKAAKQSRMAGMQVRSGVKAGRHMGEPGQHGIGGMHI